MCLRLNKNTILVKLLVLFVIPVFVLSSCKSDDSSGGSEDSPSKPVNYEGDDDLDTLTGQQEVDGWVIQIDTTGTGVLTTIHVTSDPFLSDTDGDGLTDQEEKVYLTNPRKSDTDGDGLSDFDELNVYFSKPNEVDSDGDSQGNPQLFDYSEVNNHVTSPSIPDTDGDGLSDYEEIINRGSDYNPRYANIPSISVSYTTGPKIWFNTTFTDTSTFTESVEVSDTLSSTSTISNTNSNTNAQVIKYGQELQLGLELNSGNKGNPFPGASFSVQTNFSFGQEYTNEQTVSWSASRSKQASTTFNNYRSEEASKTVSTSGAYITGTVKLTNNGSMSVGIRDLTFNVKVADSENPRQFVTLAAVTQEIQTGDIVLTSGGTAEIALRTEGDISIAQAQEILLNALPVNFSVSTMTLYDANDENISFQMEIIESRAAMLVIDYGGYENPEKYMVATNVFRDPDTREFKGVKVIDILNDLSIPYVLNANGMVDSIRGVETISAADGMWMILVGTAAAADITTDSTMDSLVMQAGERVDIVYVRDGDDDGLFAREEYMLGTFDNTADSDGDGLSDYEEARTGWTVPILSGKVYSNPLHDGDYDYDTLTDIQEKAKETSPYLVDTDADGLYDNNDPTPNAPSQVVSEFHAQRSSTNDTTINLSWLNPSSDNLLILRRSDSQYFTDPVGDVRAMSIGSLFSGATVVYNGNGVDFTNSNLAISTTYYYRLYFYDASGIPGAGVTRFASTGAGPLYAPTALNVVQKNDATAKGLRVSWESNDSRIQKFLVIRGENSWPSATWSPTPGATYSAGQSTAAMGGTVAYYGSNVTFDDFDDLKPNNYYAYAIFSYDGTTYSINRTGGKGLTAKTDPQVYVTMDNLQCVDGTESGDEELYWNTRISYGTVDATDPDALTINETRSVKVHEQQSADPVKCDDNSDQTIPFSDGAHQSQSQVFSTASGYGFRVGGTVWESDSSSGDDDLGTFWGSTSPGIGIYTYHSSVGKWKHSKTGTTSHITTHTEGGNDIRIKFTVHTVGGVPSGSDPGACPY